MYVPEEEVGSPTSQAAIEAAAKANKYVLVTEPAREGGKIVTGRRGSARFKITVTGVPAGDVPVTLTVANQVLALGDSVVGTTTMQNEVDSIPILLTVGDTIDVGVFAVGATRSGAEWLLPLGLVGAGAAILLSERERGIDRAEERIAAELDALDPIARAQVLKRVATAEYKNLTGDEPDR